jgi:hypothetical protein
MEKQNVEEEKRKREWRRKEKRYMEQNRTTDVEGRRRIKREEGIRERKRESRREKGDRKMRRETELDEGNLNKRRWEKKERRRETRVRG